VCVCDASSACDACDACGVMRSELSELRFSLMNNLMRNKIPPTSVSMNTLMRNKIPPAFQCFSCFSMIFLLFQRFSMSFMLFTDFLTFILFMLLNNFRIMLGSFDWNTKLTHAQQSLQAWLADYQSLCSVAVILGTSSG